jgi:hypothetical protein
MQANYVEAKNILKRLHFPLSKHELIQQAINFGASRYMVEDLKNIPDREYTSSENVIVEF